MSDTGSLLGKLEGALNRAPFLHLEEWPVQVRDQLLKLLRLQHIVRDTRAGRAIVEGAPQHIEEIEARFRERNAEYVAIKDRFDALEADRSARTIELTSLEEFKVKYSNDLMQVQNQREYAAILREIDSVKAQIGGHEEAILRDMEELEIVKVELATHEEHIQSERAKVASERSAVQQAATEAEARIVELEKERASIERGLSRSLLASVQRLVAGRQGEFLANTEDGTCQACFVRVRPQGFQEVKLASKIHFCGNCKRLLYHEATLCAETSARIADAPAPTPVEATDGGSA